MDEETDINEQFDKWQDELKVREKRLKTMVEFVTDLEISTDEFNVDFLNTTN